jgi:hypothetical protein
MLKACEIFLGHGSINLVKMYRNSEIRTHKNKNLNMKIFSTNISVTAITAS